MNITDYDDRQTFRLACKRANISIKLVLHSHTHLHSPSLYESEMTKAAFKEAWDGLVAAMSCIRSSSAVVEGWIESQLQMDEGRRIRLKHSPSFTSQ